MSFTSKNTFKTTRALIGLEEGFARVKRASMEINKYASRIIESAVFQAEESAVEFVRTRVCDLGFYVYEKTRLQDALSRGQEQGLRLCLPQNGLALRAAYPEQPPGEMIFLTTADAPDSHGFVDMLTLRECKGVPSIGSQGLSINWIMDPESILVFRR